jgi:glycosyltransferase involved in cell wall biosynthesis
MTNPSQPKIAVLIPCYQEEKTIGKVVRDFRAALPAAEIYVFDNNCTDRTAQIAREHGARVVSVSHRQIAATRNAGARVATGDNFVFVDADTLVSHEVLIAALAALRAGAIGGGAALHFDGEVPLFARVVTPVALWLLRLFRGAPGCFIFCTRAAFIAVGGFDEAFYGAEYLVMSRALKQHGRFVILHESVTTSGRKLRTHTLAEMLWLLLRLGIFGSGVIKQRRGMDFWYGERRDDAEEKR